MGKKGQGFFADFHVHVGAAQDQIVKVTASQDMTIQRIIDYARNVKGLDVVGIIDAISPNVILDLEELIEGQVIREHHQGGLICDNGLMIILGGELEISVGEGRGHFLVYFPNLTRIKSFSDWLAQYTTNISLRSQLTRIDVKKVIERAKNDHGLFMPAHAFTPHKSLFGSCINYMDALKDIGPQFDGLELGLSADKSLADMLPELSPFTYLSNSDAHSLTKIAREYNEMKLASLNFEHVAKTIKNIPGFQNSITNFGLPPQLGKYYRSYCLDCEKTCTPTPPVLSCPMCGDRNMVIGVLDRIVQLSGCTYTKKLKDYNPGYVHQVPLEMLPGIGQKTVQKLVASFGSEMDILHRVDSTALRQIVQKDICELIMKSRRGDLAIKSGGGGYYGTVSL